MGYWFYIDGQKMGPFQSAQIADLVAKGRLTSETPVWKQGMPKWARPEYFTELITSYPQLKKTSQVEPPPLNSSTSVAQTEYADFGNRFTAGIIDGVILFIAAMIIEEIVPGILNIGAWAGYYIVMASKQGGGQTLGYKAMRIRLVEEDSGLPPSINKTCIWYLVFFFANIVGWIWYFRDPNRRMLHNIASKTVVVKLKKLEMR